MHYQLDDSKRGEIEFRRKLFEQQVKGKKIFEDEYDALGIKKILKERMEKTEADMRQLVEQGVKVSPYLEIGAERGQRALAMENDFSATGAAADISFDMLRSCTHYAEAFGKTRIPTRVCCDANILPFRTGSVPFVFCYETLHHFPNPLPVVTEIRRVLSPGGVFFFNEEPYKKVLHVNLYKAPKAYSEENLRAGTIRKIIDHFFAEESTNEVEHGIIENDEITLRTWKETLDLFAEKKAVLSYAKKFKVDLYGSRNLLKLLLAYLFGGEISATCQKPGSAAGRVLSIQDAFCCPECLEVGKESGLMPAPDAFVCQECATSFPLVDGVVFLLSHGKLATLYPEIHETLKRA